LRQLAGREWLVAAAGSSLVLGAVVLWGIHEPLQAARQEYLRDAQVTQRQIVTVTNYQNAHLDLSAYGQELTDRKARADKALPAELAQGDFLSLLQREALRHHVALQQVTPQAVQRQQDMQVLPVEVRFRCTYFDLLAFLRGLRESERCIQVERTAVRQQEGRLDCVLVLRIYAWAGDGPVDND